jgi:hypothetical protein
VASIRDNRQLVLLAKSGDVSGAAPQRRRGRRKTIQNIFFSASLRCYLFYISKEFISVNVILVSGG